VASNHGAKSWRIWSTRTINLRGDLVVRGNRTVHHFATDRCSNIIQLQHGGSVGAYARGQRGIFDQRLFTEATKNQVFSDEIFVLQAIYPIDLGIMASDMLQKLFEDKLAAIIRLDGKTDQNRDAFLVLEAFITLAALQFFTITGERYQMVIPPISLPPE
jgi:hypothetical protein